MAKKNYGIMKYTKQHTRPKPKHCVQYLSDMFELHDLSRVAKIYNEEIKKAGYSAPHDTHNKNMETIRAIFLEKQLAKHDRGQFSKTVVASGYAGETIRDITRDFLNKDIQAQKELCDITTKMADPNTNQDELYLSRQNLIREYNQKRADESKLREEYRTVLKKAQMPDPQGQRRSHPDPKMSDINKLGKQAKKDLMSADNKRLAQEIMNAMHDNEDMLAIKLQEKSGVTCVQHDGNRYNGRPTVEILDNMEKTLMGEYKNIPLHKKLQEILDTILGNAEIRSIERGFNRPSRFSHFVKDCFLPVYRCNKPRKRPAFYIDASGSMEERRGNFRCVTSAISAFLYTQHKRISELRPRYFAFTSRDTAVEFNIKSNMPIANGGTSVRFLCNVKENENNVIITDAEFESYELATVRLWAQAHKKAQVNWIVNNETQAERLRTALIGMKNQKVHYTAF